MSSELNPYQPPQEDEGLGAGQGGADDFRVEDGPTLLVKKGTILPAICPWSGEHCAGGRRETNFAWAPPWTRILLLSPPLYVIVCLLLRKRGRLSYCLGIEAQRRRKRGLLLVWGALLGCVALLGIGAALELQDLVLFATMAVWLVLFAAFFRAPPLPVVRIDEHHVRIQLSLAAAAAFARARSA